MTDHNMHFLQLTAGGANWARIGVGRAGLEMVASGRVEGQGVDALDRWLEVAGRLGPDTPVALVDGRNMMFNLAIELPAAALKQADNIARLKIRQELGLSDDQVLWTSTRQAGVGGGPNRVMVDVIWRDALRDVQDWRAARGLARMWVGGDLTAVRSLMTRASGPGPIHVVDIQEGGATIFAREADDHLTRTRVELADRPEPTSTAAQNSAASAAEPPANAPTRVLRTGDDAWRADVRRALGTDRIEWVEPRFDGGGAGEKAVAAQFRAGGSLAGLGPVLAGALCDVRGPAHPLLAKLGVGHAMTTRGLIDGTTGAVAGPALRPATRPIWVPAAALGLAALTLGFAFGGSRSSKERSRLALLKEANSLDGRIKTLQAQSQVLAKVKADRKFVTPVYETILRSVPKDVSFDTINLSEAGALQIEGKAQSQDAPTQFFESMAASKLFERSQLQDIKMDSKGKFSFQFSALLKDRRKR